MARKLTILYGSQTGCAQDLAEQIYRESKIYHFRGPVSSMDDYDVRNLINEKFVVFVCSTTGQGEEPDNMKIFWKFLLRKNLPSDSLSELHFGVIGLGDSSYAKFNFVAKRLNRRLQQLGGTEIIPIGQAFLYLREGFYFFFYFILGLCDDQHDLGITATVIPWLENLWQKLLVLSPLPNGAMKLLTIPNQFKWKIEIIDDEKENNSRLKPDHLDMYQDSALNQFEKPFFGKVIVSRKRT